VGSQRARRLEPPGTPAIRIRADASTKYIPLNLQPFIPLEAASVDASGRPPLYAFAGRVVNSHSRASSRHDACLASVVKLADSSAPNTRHMRAHHVYLFPTVTDQGDQVHACLHWQVRHTSLALVMISRPWRGRGQPLQCIRAEGHNTPSCADLRPTKIVLSHVYCADRRRAPPEPRRRLHATSYVAHAWFRSLAKLARSARGVRTLTRK
jgi:hypothetical protein